MVHPIKGQGLGKPGVFRGYAAFSNTALADYTWPLFEVRGSTDGPRLCISAGVHVNEVSSIEAAIRLQQLFDPQTLRGSVSIIPVINQPALYKYTEYACPIDGKNINFTFPGNASGTFSEALCDAVQHEWCAESDCYVDMHGGDLRESISRFSIFQRTGDAALDRLGADLATCFDADVVVGLPESHMLQPGRPPTGFAREGRIAIMSEAGANGLLNEDDIDFHVRGVLNIAGKLGMIDNPEPHFKRRRMLCDDYLWISNPADGQFYAETEPGNLVSRGQRLGTIRDFFGHTVGEIMAPEAGIVLWRMSHPTLKKGAAVLALAVEQ
ncbi:MAG: succinylglutamate desuccinylase/aspartoacylase family protein [Parvibaculaceae bacterium]